MNSVPTVEAYKAYVTQLVATGRIQALQIWNEPNGIDFYQYPGKPKDTSNAAEYGAWVDKGAQHLALLTQAAYRAVGKKVEIIGPGFSSTSIYDASETNYYRRFIVSYYKKLDALYPGKTFPLQAHGIHAYGAYGGRDLPANESLAGALEQRDLKLKAFRSIISKYSTNRPIWDTEWNLRKSHQEPVTGERKTEFSKCFPSGVWNPVPQAGYYSNTNPGGCKPAYAGAALRNFILSEGFCPLNIDPVARSGCDYRGSANALVEGSLTGYRYGVTRSFLYAYTPNMGDAFTAGSIVLNPMAFYAKAGLRNMSSIIKDSVFDYSASKGSKFVFKRLKPGVAYYGVEAATKTLKVVPGTITIVAPAKISDHIKVTLKTSTGVKTINLV